MTTEQPEALQLADDLDAEAGRITQYTNSRGDLLRELAAAELRRQHAEIETLRAGYDTARLEIASLQARVQELGKAARDVNSRRVQELEAQLEAIGAGGVEPLRKRECLHKISEPAQAQPVDLEPVAAQSRFLTEKGWGTCTLEHHLYVKANPAEWPGYETRALYAAPQPAAPAQAATAKQSPHPEYDKGFSDGWNRCEERQAAAPAQAGEREFVSRAGWVESAMRVYLIAGDTEKEARECAEYLWSEAGMDDLPDPIGAAMEDCEGRGAAQAAPVEAENEIDLLAEAALCERLDACLAAARAAQGIK